MIWAQDRVLSRLGTGWCSILILVCGIWEGKCEIITIIMICLQLKVLVVHHLVYFIKYYAFFGHIYELWKKIYDRSLRFFNKCVYHGPSINCLTLVCERVYRFKRNDLLQKGRGGLQLC